MSDTPSVSREAPKTAPPAETKPAVQNNESDSKSSPATPNQK
jgi:hypothetical protein